MTARLPARRVAGEIGRHGLTAPARLLIDAHRPLAPLLGDLGAAIGPLVGVVFGRSSDDLRAIVEDPGGLDGLVDELDRSSARGARAVAG